MQEQKKELVRCMRDHPQHAESQLDERLGVVAAAIQVHTEPHEEQLQRIEVHLLRMHARAQEANGLQVHTVPRGTMCRGLSYRHHASTH